MKPRRLSSRGPAPAASGKAALATLLPLGWALVLGSALGIASCPLPGGGKPAGPPEGRSGPGAGRPAAESTAVFLPPGYFAGDEVEALVPLGNFPNAPAEGFTLRPGAGLPAPGAFADPAIRSVTIERTASGWEAKILFVPWSPGPGGLPAIGARGILVPPVSYDVSSSLGPDDRDLAPPRPQREPPGTALYLYGFAALALVLALSSIGAALYLVPAARAILVRWKAAQAYRRLCRSVTFLSRGLESAVPELFYAALARELRLYLAERIERRVPNLSSTEFAALPEALFPAAGIRESAAALVAETERGRYAGELAAGSASAAILRSAADRAIALGTATEEALDARL
ncbi:MAG: hypothetical protein ACLQMF_04875 [Rectinemataceae bacterium]